MKGGKKPLYRGTVGIALLPTLALLLALAGCGSGGSSTQASAHESAVTDRSITKTELIKNADLICRHTDEVQRERLAAYQAKHSGEPLTAPSEEEKALAYAALPPIATEIDEVEALGVPRGGAKLMEAILEGWKEGLKELEQKPSLMLGPSEGPFARPDKLAGKFGYIDCAEAL